jgi:hypothetical protein
MRPRYETEEDLKNEKIFMDFIRSKGNEITKLSEFNYQVDFAIHTGSKLLMLCEFKRRNCVHDKYPTFMVSLGKWLKLKYFLKEGIQAGFYLMYDDGMYYVHPSARYRTGMGKNGKMRDPYDFEPMAFIGINNLERVDEQLQ